MLKKILKILAILLLLGTIAGAIVGYFVYQQIFAPNVVTAEKPMELFIPTNATYSQVVDSLTTNKILKNKGTFDWVATKMNYPNKVYPGRYLIPPKMNNRELVTLLRTGTQTPYKLAIHNIRTKDQLVARIDTVLEADSLSFATLLADTALLKSHELTPENVIAIFMADTYEFNWNTSSKQFFNRMLKEYKRFWNEERTKKAEAKKLSPFEVITLASILEEETANVGEMPRMAGVYLNRIYKDWALQADPTLKFAIGDFTIKRILNKHLEIESPYNTYKNTGLPPGPIRIPAKTAINAVLNAESHKFMYFCAKEDFSGTHNFATTLREHNINARKYQRELDRRRIMK